MYRVLVPVDGDEDRAGAQADAVANLPGGDETMVTLLRVCSSRGEAAAMDVSKTASGALATQILKDEGVRVESQTRVGDPAEEILSTAEDVDADAIVLGGRKRSPLGSLLFGSVTQAVVVDATRPVTVTGAESAESPTHECADCGETYYADTDTGIATCRRCGGTHVEPTEEAAPEA